MTQDAIPATLPATSGDISAAAMDPMFEMVLGSRLTFTQRLDPEVLARAVRLLTDLEPVLGCWFDERLLNAGWVRCTDLEVFPLFSMLDTDNADRDAAEFHARSFEERGPRVAVLLLRSVEHDDLCIRFDHVAGDGWSAKEVTHLLAETYSRLLEDPAWTPTPRLSPRPAHSDVWQALTDEQRAAAAKAPPVSGSKWRMKTNPGTGNSLTIRTLTLEAERVAAIREYVHARGGTVNEALVTALVRSAASMYPPREGVRPGVSISADPRWFARATNLDRISLLATTQTVLMDHRRGETFDETLQHVIDAVRPWRESLWSIAASAKPGPAPAPVLMRAFFGLLATMMRTMHFAGLVTMNIGAFDEERLAFGEARPVSAVGTGPIPRFGGFPALISSYRGSLTLWMGFRERTIARELVERYLDGIDQQLAGALQPTLD